MLFSNFNFDMLQSIVEEVNRYGGPVNQLVEFLNVKPSHYSSNKYDVKLYIDGQLLTPSEIDPEIFQGNPFDPKGVRIEYDIDNDNDHWEAVIFNLQHLTQHDPQRGILEFKFDKYHLILTKSRPNEFSFRNFYLDY